MYVTYCVLLYFLINKLIFSNLNYNTKSFTCHTIVMSPNISKPHPKWKTELNESDREREWKYAAGKDKSKKQHQTSRAYFIRKANEDSARAKNGVNLTTKDRAVLKKKQVRLSKWSANNQVNMDKPGYRDKQNAKQRAKLQIPENRQKDNARATATRKANTNALQAERALDFEAKGVGLTTEYGLGDNSREDELERGAYNLMKNPAGVHHQGDATITNWIKDHGSKSIEEVLVSGDWAAYFFITKQKITPGEEIKCRESTAFMSSCLRDPLWRIQTVDNEKQRDFRLFTSKEAKTVIRSYALVKCVSAFDATGLEGVLQHYIEEMGLPHGLCLHQKAGAGSRIEYGSTKPETTWVALSLIRVKSPTFADIDPSNANRYLPLTSCQVTSHDGQTTYDVSVRGNKQKFSDTNSVIADEAKNAASRLQASTRRNKRKAEAISTSQDDSKPV